MDQSLGTHLGSAASLEQLTIGPESCNNTPARTPAKTPSKSSARAASACTTPFKTPNSRARGKTPNKGSRTPGDRFIPNRGATQMDLAHYKLCTQTTPSAEEWARLTPSQQQYRQAMRENLNGDALHSKIIAFNQKPPQTPDGHQNRGLKMLFSGSKPGEGSMRQGRHIPHAAERILDAPEIMDDYYLSLISWSSKNVLAVALAGSVYTWNADTGSITQLMELDENSSDYVSSLSWMHDGDHIAVGLSSGHIEIWDYLREKRLRTMTGHAARVGSLSWNSNFLSSGCRTGAIHHHDLRVEQHQVGSAQGHNQEVCGLQWSPTGTYLASGGNDNLINIWGADPGSRLTASSTVQTFNQHQAAVKALAWCPWQPNVLASGGGTADRHIRIWNCNNGASLGAVDTHSQVCAILWSSEYREIISGHGFVQNQLTIWKYPQMTKVADLTGHTARILHMCMSPDGATVVSAGADETLRLWKCFAVDEEIKKLKFKANKKEDRSCLKLHIR